MDSQEFVKKLTQFFYQIVSKYIVWLRVQLKGKESQANQLFNCGISNRNESGLALKLGGKF